MSARWEVRHGDCLGLMRAMPDGAVESVVTDPPYGLAFMGKDWDHGVPGIPFWREALRVAKPGAHLLAFGGTRTHHRLMCAIEDAGWEIRDCVSWLYGSGFPKSHNGAWGGTALKPAHEPIVLARKSLIGTVAANVAAHGTGGLNIDGCRIAAGPGDYDHPGDAGAVARHDGRVSWRFDEKQAKPHAAGRWPPNVALDETAAAMLDAMSGERTSTLTGRPADKDYTSDAVTNGLFGRREQGRLYGDTGGASRFMYCPKASRSEREAGLEGMEARVARRYGEQGQGPLPQQTPREHRAAGNHHPTVKPIALMRWLCRLITPPGGLILDPFAGSGTTGIAAALEGFRFVGMEREAEYVEIARRRVAHWAGLTPDQLALEFGEAA